MKKKGGKKKKKGEKLNKNNIPAAIDLAKKILIAPTSSISIEQLISDIENIKRVSKIMEEVSEVEKVL